MLRAVSDLVGCALCCGFISVRVIRFHIQCMKEGTMFGLFWGSVKFGVKLG